MLVLYIVIAVFVIYFLILYILHKKGVFKGERLSLYGPFIMLKTRRGRKFIDKLSKPKRFWSVFGTLGIIICFVAMFAIMVMLLWSAFLVPQIPAEDAPTPEMLLGIPGLNPLIPLWYGIFALIIAIVIHEFSHGILTRAANLEIRSLGLLFFILPLGAFVEPDEEGLKKVEKKKRMRVFAAGAAVNILVALLCALIFSWGFMGSVVPKHDGVIINGVLEDTPNEDAGLKLWSEITHIEGERIENLEDYYAFDAPPPNATINVTIFYQGSFREIKNVTSGVFLTSVSKDYPAYGVGLRSKMMIAELNGTEIRTEQNLSYALDLTNAGQTVNITFYGYDVNAGHYVKSNASVVLADKYEYYEKYFPGDNEMYLGKGFLGINSRYLGIMVKDIHEVPHKLTHPFSGVDSFGDFIGAGIYYISLPFPTIGLSPLQSPVTDLYEVSGPLAVLPPDIFWPLANIFYWLFWINLMLGLTNTLPAVPLDGGYLFKDALDGLVKKLKKDMSPEARERVVSTISITLALFILFLILWTFIGPRI